MYLTNNCLIDCMKLWQCIGQQYSTTRRDVTSGPIATYV